MKLRFESDLAFQKHGIDAVCEWKAGGTGETGITC